MNKTELAQRLWRTVPPQWQERLRATPGVQQLLTAAEHALFPPDAALMVGGYRLWVPPGHFYSPLPDLADVRARHAQIFPPPPEALPGIELNTDAQLARMRSFAAYAREQPFPEQPHPDFRFHYENDFFSYADGHTLYCMLRQLAPRRYLEIGSGFSSALALDVNERYLGGRMQITLIEPYPDRLRARLRPGDEARFALLQTGLQAAPPSLFSQLEPGDVLFVDSTHVSKVGSDVNQILFQILPQLPVGVYVHFHDIFYPFEYPAEWVYEGRAWNENYMLRAFLSHSRAYSIEYFNHYLAALHADALRAHTPLALRNTGGSIWLRRA